jgi:hypothetical protein
LGQHISCNVRFGDVCSAGVAQLEADELRFRGDYRLTIPFSDISSLDAVDGVLVVTFPRGVAHFELGQRAAKWAEAIRHPKRLIDKLDVKPSQRIAVLGITDTAFLAQLHERVPQALLTNDPPPGDDPFDLLFLAAEEQSDLAQIPSLAQRLQPAGALWVVAPKGQRHLREIDVLHAGRAAGLTDIKVARFSATHTAHKFVIPRERR